MLRKLLVGGAHLIFWAVFSLFSLASGFRIMESWDFIASYYHIYLIHLLWAAIIFYSFYFYFAPIYIEKKKLVKYLLFSITLSIFATVLFSQIIFRTNPDIVHLENNVLYLTASLVTFVIAQCGALLRGFVNWYDQLERKAELEKRSLQMELDLLKSQLNPHFLFNTLNNIDAMIHSAPSQASEAVILLSNMLRYMVYDTNREFVPLESEKAYLEQYISLQKLRYRQPDNIHFDSNIKNDSTPVAPMLFLIFVENAFKHGSGNNSIVICLHKENEQIHFTCKNYFADKTSEKSKGLGLVNIRKRLELIYPKRHQLDITHSDGIFTVNLIIDPA